MNPEIELAQLSLHGRRYSEAEEKFSKLLSGEDAPSAWLGLSLAKFGKLPAKGSTPDEVIYCFNKVLSLSPDRKDEVHFLVISAARAVLEDITEMVPRIQSAESKARSAYVSGLLHKGYAMMRATGNSGSRPTLFTNLDSLHDSYRGSALLDASAELQGDATKLRAHLIAATRNIQKVISSLSPSDVTMKNEFSLASNQLVEILSEPQKAQEKLDEHESSRPVFYPKKLWLRVKTIEKSRPEIYRSTGAYTSDSYYRSSDQKIISGLCGGISHKFKWNPLYVRILFIAVAITSYGLYALIYIAGWIQTKKILPTKGII